jgi:hypothetical protein
MTIELTGIGGEKQDVDPRRIVGTSFNQARGSTTLYFEKGGHLAVTETPLEIARLVDGAGLKPRIVPQETAWIW